MFGHLPGLRPGFEEVTEHNGTFPFQKLDAYAVAKAMAMAVHGAKISHRELRDQAERASVSTFLQLSEGLPNDAPGMRRRYFTIARNSLCEVVAAIDLALALDAIAEGRANEVLAAAHRLRGMLVALAR